MFKSKTIRRNAKRIKNLAQTAKSIKVHTLDNCFIGDLIDSDKVSEVAGRIALNKDIKFQTLENGMILAHVHSNRFYYIED